MNNRQQAKGLILLVLCLLVLDVLSQSAICSYSYRKRIAFDPTKVSGTSDLANFTALISVTSDNDLRTVGNSGHVQNANGFDIIFTADDGVTRLDFQLEKYTATSGELVTWVRIPILSKTYITTIYMYYGNAAITTDQSVSSTWSSSYKGVWHLHNNSFNDGTASANTGTNSGSTNLAAAKIGGGRSFAGTGTSYVQLPLIGASGGSGASTIEFWGLMGTAVASRYFFGESSTQNAVYTDRIQIYIGDNAGALYLGIGNNHTIQTNVQVLTANTWYHIALAWSGTGAGAGSYSVFVNGVQRGTGSYSGFSSIYTSGDIGNDGNAGQRTEELTGSMDEVRISNIALTSDWILTEYNNQNSPSTFYTISAEPKVWNGTTSSGFITATNWLNSALPASGDDIIINNGANQPALQANQQANSVYIRPGATFSLSAFNLSVYSDVSNCGTITGNTGSLTLNSTATQTQNLSGSGTYNLTSLAVNNTFSASPVVVLNKDVNVAGALVLTSGIVHTSTTNILALGSGATSTGGSVSSFISGPISKTGSTNFVFPVGKGSSWRRAGVSNLTASATFRAEYFNAPYTNVSSVNSPMDNVSHDEYWEVDQVSGSASAYLSLYWENAAASGIDNCSDLTIARFNGSSWDEKPGAAVPGSTCSGAGTGVVTTVSLVTAFSPFTFGSKLSGVNPLPIELTEFKASCAGSSVILSWTTASEKNNTGFTIEKSMEDNHWTTVGHVAGAGNSTHRTTYSLNDPDVLNGDVYYRLLQTDAGGTSKVYKVIASNCSSGDNLLLYPNPAAGELTLEISLTANYGENELRIIDNQGRICFLESVSMSRGRNVLKIHHNLSAGSYSLLFSSSLPVLPVQKLIIVK